MVRWTVDIEREDLPFGKVVFEELMNTHSCVVDWAPGTSLTVGRGEGERGGRESENVHTCTCMYITYMYNGLPSNPDQQSSNHKTKQPENKPTTKNKTPGCPALRTGAVCTCIL